MKVIIRLFILLFILVFATTACAGSLNLAWNPSPEPDIGGYKLYYWEDGGTEQVVDAGNVVVYELTGLVTGTYYTIEATAYDTAGNESDRSYGVRDKAGYSVVRGLEIK